MRRSSEVKETKEGVVKEPCSLATMPHVRLGVWCILLLQLTDLNAGALVVGDT